MHVGLIGGLGLTLGDFLRIKAHGAQKYYKTVEGPAKSVIHIYLPGEWLTKSHGTLNPCTFGVSRSFWQYQNKIPGVHLANISRIKNCRKITVADQ